MGAVYNISQWIIGPTGEHHRAASKAKPTRRRSVFGGVTAGDSRARYGDRPPRCALLLGASATLSKYAMYAQNEQVHVAAWPDFSVYDPFAHALSWEVNNAAARSTP